MTLMKFAWFKGLLSRPILLSVLGWLLFPGMYLAVGILTALKVQVELAFLIAAPLGILGYLSWVLSFFVSFRKMVWSQSKVASIIGILFSGLPLALFTYGFIFVIGTGGV